MVAERVLDLMAQSAWSGSCKDERVSKTIFDHADHLRQTRGPHSSRHAAIVDAVQIIACIQFPDWECSNDWLHDALKALPKSLSMAIHPDGSPIDSPVLHQERVWLAILAQSALLAVHRTLNETSLSLLSRAVQFFVDFSGPGKTLPMLGETRPKLAQQTLPCTPSTMAHVAHQWFGIECPGMETADWTARRLGCTSDVTTPWSPPRHWTAHKWALAGLSAIHNGRHRVVGRASDQSVWWAIQGRLLVHGSGTNGLHGPPTLRTVRTDDRVALMEFAHRRIRIEGSRLTIIDAPSTQRHRIHFPKDSRFTANGLGHTVHTQYGVFEVRSKQTWHTDESSLVLVPERHGSTIRIEYRGTDTNRP